MPWSPNDNLRIRRALNLSNIYALQIKAHLDTISDEAEIGAIQGDLGKLEALDLAIEESVSSAGIEELVGDIKFRSGGQTQAYIDQRQRVLMRVIRALGIDEFAGYQTRFERSF